MDDLSELYEKQFTSALRQVSNMDEEVLTEFFDDFFIQLVNYEPSTDAIMLQFELDREKGIDRWRLNILT